jgi:hypothetical protein
VIRTSKMSPAQFSVFLRTHSVSGAKGDEAIKSQEAQQLGFNRQLAATFSQQFGQQSGILNFLNEKLTAQVNNPEGFTPEQRAALETTNTEGAAKAYAQAQTATNGAVAARGGSTLPSGVNAQLTAENANAGAEQLVTGERQIAVADAEQKQNNTWRALSGLDTVASAENPTVYGSLYNGGSATVGNLGEEYNATQQSPLFATLGAVAGGAVSAVGTYLGRPKVKP